MSYPTCTSPFVLRLPFIFAQNLLEKSMYKLNRWQMIRDHKFHTDLEYKQRCIDKPMNIL